MRKTRNDPDRLEEYDFRGGVRGKYAKRYAQGTNIVLVDPDLLEFFPDSQSANEALRGLVEIITRRQKGKHTPVRKCSAA